MTKKQPIRYTPTNIDRNDEVAFSPQHHRVARNHRRRQMGIRHRVVLRRGRSAVSFEKTSRTKEIDTRRDSGKMDASTFVCHLVSASS